ALRRKINCLGVAAAFDVEDAFVTPTMLVVADEMTLRIRSKSGFAWAAEAGEQRRCSFLFVRCRRALHRKDATPRREIVRHGEDAFLHLAGVFGSQNDEF